MSADSSAARPDHQPLPPEARATALWVYVKAKAPRFTYDAALATTQELNPRPGGDPKVLARHLRKALAARGIAIKHTNALHAVARMLGNTSWHTYADSPTARLEFTSLVEGPTCEREFPSWSELADALRGWVDTLHARGRLPLGILTLNFTGRVLNLWTPGPRTDDRSGQTRNESWPLGLVTPLTDDRHWLDDAPAALEKLRRHLEETGTAVLDGYEVLRLCATSRNLPSLGLAVTAADVINSELVLRREDLEDDPQGGYEIARGDELTCWYQLELSLRDDATDAPPPAISVTVPTEGVGAWFVNGTRFVWSLETIKPNDYVPGRVHSQIGPRECEHLLRRYRLAKRIQGGGFKHHAMTKTVDYLSGPPQVYRVDLHHVLHLMRAAGLTWETYLEKFDSEPLPMEATLPAGFVLQMLENLAVENPNAVFAKPNLSEMARVDDDSLLRSLMPRVYSVRYVKPRYLEERAAQDLHKAVEQFNDALRLQKAVAVGALPMEPELPYLVYASDAEEFRASAAALGLRMYVAVVPHLIPTKGVIPAVPGVNMLPWAFGHALFVRFETTGSPQ